MKLASLKDSELLKINSKAKKEYEKFKSLDLKLDMSRGKPCADQLDLALGFLEALRARSEFANSDGDDCRNYGIWNGLPEMREIFSQLMDVPADLIILGNNSSLQLMFDCISKGYTHGYDGCEPWCKQEKIKFLCPSPGYDRHFSITEYFGFEMITVPMLKSGPDMDMIEELISNDETIKGCWCVPKYSNPTGVTYSDKTVRRFAKLKPKAKDFRIMWDNAYCVHDLTDTPDTLLSLYDEALKNGTEDYCIFFASTSKISFPGAGVAAVGMSKSNYEEMKIRLTTQTIGPDKLNQLRHLRFLHDVNGVYDLMQEHRKILEPKFDLVRGILEDNLGGMGVATWNKPNGGYFINLDVMNGCAKKVVKLCKKAGVVLTGAGAAFPLGEDPNDSNIRIAPTFPPIEELEQAAKLLCICVKLATTEKLISDRKK